MNGYMVFVEKSRAPKRIHETIEIAQGEADRLAKLVPYKKVYILEIIGVIEPTESAPEKPTVVREPKVIEATVKPVEVAPVKVKTSNTLSLPKKGVAK